MEREEGRERRDARPNFPPRGLNKIESTRRERHRENDLRQVGWLLFFPFGCLEPLI